jgi:hypothetical protein
VRFLSVSAGTGGGGTVVAREGGGAGVGGGGVGLRGGGVGRGGGTAVILVGGTGADFSGGTSVDLAAGAGVDLTGGTRVCAGGAGVFVIENSALFRLVIVSAESSSSSDLDSGAALLMEGSSINWVGADGA